MDEHDEFDDVYGEDYDFWNSPDTHLSLDQLEKAAYMSEPLASGPSNGGPVLRGEPTSSTSQVAHVNDAVLSASNAAALSEPVGKRGRGRPKKLTDDHDDGTIPVPFVEPPRRKPGRPCGTGPNQRARARDAALGVIPEPKRRPGRPKKRVDSEADSVSVEFGQFRMPGTQRRASPMESTPLTDGNGPAPLITSASTSASAPNPGPTFPSTLPFTLCPPSEPRNSQHLQSVPSIAHTPLPQRAHTKEVVPGEDPQCPIELDRAEDGDDSDEDGYAGFIEDGLGGDNDGVGQEEDSDDEEDPAEAAVHEDDSFAGAKQQARRPLPEWLSSEFQAKVKESNTRGQDGLPPLYRDHETFWFPQKSTFFLLRKTVPPPEHLYNPRFFLWDPMALCPEGIRCPNCKAVLRRHSHLRHPRRCVDLDSSFWLIGYRYRCPDCCHPKSGKHTVTFRSYDSRILATLPRRLVLEFPACLTHRSGLSQRVFSVLRSCIQNGMGPTQFADALRVQHLQRHDTVKLQYLHSLVLQKDMAEWQGRKFEVFLSYDDNSEKGPWGFSPCAEWLRDLYDHCIEAHRPELNQHMSMLSAEICSVDHSHKITKHIAKIMGIIIFIGLLTITNEKGEIRVCNLVGSKSHDSFRHALEQMRISLDLYGHAQPTVFYTDNMADKQFLEGAFPSLRQNIVPVEKYAHLEPFMIPAHIQVQVKTTPSTIDDDMRKILDTLPLDGSEQQIVLGFDSEWNVEASSYGGVVSRGKTAVVQIAHESTIYILQVGQLLASKKLPHHLKLLLRNPNVIKVGRLINSDLQYLQTACEESEPFVGGVDLAKLARERNLVSTARCSLSDLCAAVLGKRLDKNVPERLSNQWENDELTKEQIDYAARDAYVSLVLYHAISRICPPQPLPPHPEPGTLVQVYHDDNARLIAYGRISDLCKTKEFDGVQVLRSRTVVEVTEVLVPGAILGLYKKPLSKFGPTPFNLVVIQSHLKLLESPKSTPQTPAFIPTNQPPSPIDGSRVADANILIDGSDNCDSYAQLGENFTSIADDLVGGSSPETTFGPRNIDPDSVEEGNQILEPVPSEWPTHIRSRVLKDIFHIFKMFYIHRAHGLRAEFTRALRDAFFLVDEEDKLRINAWGATQNPPVSFDNLKQTSSKFLWKHCRRIVPPPELLYPIVDNVFRTFGPLKDAQTGQPLFNTNNWKVAKNVLALIRDGYVSDPPGVPLYTQIGINKKVGGLPVYRCSRGTNQTEGSVHTHLRPRLPTSGASVRHVNASLLDFILRHNLLVGTFNSTGKRYRGHFDIWIINELQELLIYLQDMFIDDPKISGWVNGNLYTPTTEVAGVLPVPSHVREISGMLAYEPSLDSPRRSRQQNQFLASLQGTRKPVLPIHSALEKELFLKLLKEHKAFNSSTSGNPDWKQAVKVWNRHAVEMDGVFYKLTEHLMMYFSGWKTTVNVKESLSMSAEARLSLRDVILDPKRTLHAPPVPVQPLRPNQVDTGFLSVSEEESRSSSSASPVSDLLPEPANSIATRLSRKRVATALEDSRPKKKARSRRHCAKCGLDSCNGKQQVSRCLNKCRDCGKAGSTACQGRDTKRPDVPCYNR